MWSAHISEAAEAEGNTKKNGACLLKFVVGKGGEETVKKKKKTEASLHLKMKAFAALKTHWSSFELFKAFPVVF